MLTQRHGRHNMTRLRIWLARWASGKAVLGGVAVVVAYNAVMARYFFPSRARVPRPPDLRFFYTPETLEHILAAWMPHARRFFLGHLVVDALYPLLYGTVFALGLAWLYRAPKGEPAPAWTVLLPGMAVLADLGENLVLSLLMAQMPHPDPFFAWGAAWLTCTKWLFVGASTLAVVLGLVRGRWKGLRSDASGEEDS